MIPMGMIHKKRRKLESRLSGRSGYSTRNVSGNDGRRGSRAPRVAAWSTSLQSLNAALDR